MPKSRTLSVRECLKGFRPRRVFTSGKLMQTSNVVLDPGLSRHGCSLYTRVKMIIEEYLRLVHSWKRPA